MFEYLLRVVGKILLLSNWMNNRSDELDDYYYDVYFIILEFLIDWFSPVHKFHSPFINI